MSAPTEKVVAKFEATVATGLESIAQEEVNDKLLITESSVHQGRVVFSTSDPISQILKLKSISNLFVIIYDTILSDDEIPKDSSCLEPLLMQVGDKCDWEVGLSKWQEMSKFTTSMEKILAKNMDLRPSQPKFRVSCNRYGPKHNFTSPEICSVFGHVVDTKFGWPIKMKEFDLEVMVNFSVNHLYVGLTLTPLALDRRNIISTGLTTLRAATCYALLRVAKIQTGDIVIDPMAGSGAIPVECLASWNDEWKPYMLAGELKPVPLEKSRSNMGIFERRLPSDLLQLDVTSMPFRQDSIDVFVSDLPFGKRHGSKRINKTLYPALVLEMARVARLGTSRAVLLTQDFKSMNLALEKGRNFWTQKRCNFVKIGNLNCYIYLLMRTARSIG